MKTPDDIIDEKLAEFDIPPTRRQLAAVKLIWRKLSPALRSKVSIDLLRDFLAAILDDELSAKDAAAEVGIPISKATELWQAVERTGLV